MKKKIDYTITCWLCSRKLMTKRSDGCFSCECGATFTVLPKLRTVKSIKIREIKGGC